MLDVHPPHAATHSWKDFFIHIATITVGLLIAVGLEQSVEALNRHREREELLASLHHECSQILRDTERVEAAESDEITWNRQVNELIAAAAKTHRPIGQLPPHPNQDFDIPDDPVFTAAKAANKFALLTQEEVQAYGEMDGLLAKCELAYVHRREAIVEEAQTQGELGFSQPGTPFGTGFADVTLPFEDLKRIYKNSVRFQVSATDFRYWSRQARGAAIVMQAGERNLHKIEDAERQFNNLP